MQSLVIVATVNRIIAQSCSWQEHHSTPIKHYHKKLALPISYLMADNFTLQAQVLTTVSIVSAVM